MRYKSVVEPMKMLKKFALPLKSIWIDFSCRSIDLWYEVTGPFVRAWWRFKHWKRRRNPELVELDAFRELLEIERRLKDYPNAKPLLERANELYKITGQADKCCQCVSVANTNFQCQ